MFVDHQHEALSSLKFLFSFPSFAEASPFEKDPRRGLNAVGWAKLCGRKFCHDAMSEFLKKRVPPVAVQNTKAKMIGRYSCGAKTDGNVPASIRPTFSNEINFFVFRIPNQA